jgi:hypothetical protein
MENLLALDAEGIVLVFKYSGSGVRETVKR